MSDPVSLNYFVIALFLGLLALAALSDATNYRIPNRISAAVAALYPVHVLTATRPIDVLAAVLIAGVVLVIGIVLFAFRAVGGGDVKLLAATSLWAGAAYGMDFLFVTSLIGGVMALIMVSPLRFTLAQAFDALGREEAGEKMLTNVLPYAIAIAGGGWFVGLRLLST